MFHINEEVAPVIKAGYTVRITYRGDVIAIDARTGEQTTIDRDVMVEIAPRGASFESQQSVCVSGSDPVAVFRQAEAMIRKAA